MDDKGRSALLGVQMEIRTFYSCSIHFPPVCRNMLCLDSAGAVTGK